MRNTSFFAWFVLVCQTHGSLWKASEYPGPRKDSVSCKANLFGISQPHALRPKLFRQICDPEGIIEEEDQRRVAVALEAFEKELMLGTSFDINVGVAILRSSAEPLPEFAKVLASAWGLAGKDQALIVLSTDARDKDGKLSGAGAASLAGGLLTTVGIRAWQAGLEQRMTMVLQSGSAADAVEAGLSGLVELLGGIPLTEGNTRKGLPLPAVRSSQMPVTNYIDGKTKWQEINLRTNVCGQTRCKQLFLEEVLQLSDRFEPYYHEAMALPALNALGEDARRVLILGGGDGGIATLALRFDTMEKVVLVDIDQVVTDSSRKYFHAVSAGLRDKRFTAHHGDALKYVHEQNDSEFDLVIIDFSDEPIEGFWSEDFFMQIKRLLSPRGALVMNEGTTMRNLDKLFDWKNKVFNSVWPIASLCPDYFSPYILSLSTKGDLDPLNVNWDFWERQAIATTYYSPLMHANMFNVPADVLLVLGMKFPTAPACPRPVPKEPEKPRFDDITELEKGKSLFKKDWSSKGMYGHKIGTVSVLQMDVRKKKKFEFWGREGVPCKDGAGDAQGCYRALYIGGRHAEDAYSPHAAVFNEAMVLPAMNILGSRARRVLVLGGGDGAMAKLILKYPHVEKVVVVESSPEVLEAVNEHFPSAQAALVDPRTTVVREDAMQYVLRTDLKGQFDLVIVNLVTNLWQAPGFSNRVPLASQFLIQLKSLLSLHGLLVQDIEGLHAPRMALRRFTIHKTVFERSWPLTIMSAHDTVTNSNHTQVRHPPRLLALSSVSALDPLDIDWTLWQQADIETYYYHPSIHRAIFIPPAEVQTLLAVTPPSNDLLCGAPKPRDSTSRDELHDKVVHHFSAELQNCQTMPRGSFFEFVSRLVLFPTYGSWAHVLKNKKRYFAILSRGAFTSFRYDQFFEAVMTLSCREPLCESLQKDLQQAATSRLNCTVQSWLPVSPVTWQVLQARSEL